MSKRGSEGGLYLFERDGVERVLHPDDHVAVVLPQRLTAHVVVVPVPQSLLHVLQQPLHQSQVRLPLRR